MKRLICICMILAIAATGCNILGSESVSSDGWKRVSLPADLKGTWVYNNIDLFDITSDQVVMNNRDWGISRIEHKGEEHRLILSSSHQYVVLYFKNISSTQTWNAVGVSSYTLYDATQSSRTDWRVIDKKASAPENT